MNCVLFRREAEVKDIANNELAPLTGTRDRSASETGQGESLELAELGRRAALVAVATLTALATGARGEVVFSI